MKNLTLHTRRAGARGVLSMRKLSAAMATVLLLGSLACNSLLEVDTPGRVPEGELDNPGMSATMVSAALGEFECAFAQYVATTGILSGEYIISGVTINSNIWGWRGQVEIKGTSGSCPTAANATGYGFYTPMQTARFLAEDWTRRITAFPDAAVPSKTSLLAQLAAYEGYALTLLGEGFCSMALNEGPEITRTDVWTRAEQRFTDAIGLATTAANTPIRNMATVGRARVRLDLGNTAGANADASLVTDPAFVRNAAYSTAEPRRENRVFNVTSNRDLAVAPAYRGLTLGSGAADPRVQSVRATSGTGAPLFGTDGVTQQWNQLKYTAKAAAIPIASYTEARLIMAEVQGGAAAIAILNALRTQRGNLAPLTPAEEADVSNPDPQVNTVIQERRRWLFSEGQRYGDMLRLGIPFPTGVNHKNQTYGNVTCIPLPDVETINNPNFQ